MIFLTPLAGLVALVVVVPLAVHALVERRARRVARRLRLPGPAVRSRLALPLAIAAVAALLGLAAAQPVVSGTRTRVGRVDAEIYFLFDTSRSMLAKGDLASPSRLTRAKRLALRVRGNLPDVPAGIVSLTDRVLPHVFPTLDAQVFASTLRDSIGIERPPPASKEELTTDFNVLSSLAASNFFRPRVAKRLVIVFSDGESRSFDDVILAQTLRRHRVHVLFVHVWGAREKIFLTRRAVDPAYRPDETSREAAQRVAAAGNGSVLSDGDASSVISAAKRFLGSGPETRLREQRTRTSLAPYLALAAVLPLSFVLLRRNL
jgi:hypothetical protein